MAHYHTIANETTELTRLDIQRNGDCYLEEHNMYVKSNLDYPFFGFMKEDCFPFRAHQLVLLHSSSSDLQVLSSINDLKVFHEIQNDLIISLTQDFLQKHVNMSNFIDQIIDSDNDFLFDLAYKHDLLEISEPDIILHLSVSKGKGNFFPYLFSHLDNVDLYCKDKNGNTLLHSAAMNRTCIKPLEILLEIFQDKCSEKEKLFLCCTNKSGLTPLHIAVCFGLADAFRILLDSGANILDNRDNEGNTALHLAAKFNRTDCIRIMFQIIYEGNCGIDNWNGLSKSKNIKRMLPVMLAHDTDCIQELLKHFDIDAIVCAEYGPLLHWACGNDNINFVQVLLNLSPPAKIDERNPQNFTPLKLAAKKGFLRIAETLLHYGCDPNFIGKEFGYPPLTNAAQYGYFDVVKLLVENGANLFTDNMRLIPLHAAAYEGKPEIVRFFLNECGMNPDILDRKKRPPLFKAINENHPDCIKILLEYGANIQISIDEKGSTPLHLAINCGERQIVKILLENGARPEEPNSFGITPLMLTTKRDHASLIPLLMSYGLALSKVDNENNTVFHHAAMNGAVRCMEYLVMRIGKMMNTGPEEQLYQKRNDDNMSVLDIGIERKQEFVLSIVIKCAPNNYFRDHPTLIHQIYDKRMYITLKFIIENMVMEDSDYVRVSPKFLDSNELGQYPNDPMFKHMIPSFLHKLLTCPDSLLKYHPLVTMTIHKKLSVYRWWYIFSFIFYFLFLFALSFALIQASYLCDDQLWDYSAHLDGLRAFCEIFCTLCSFLFLFDEIIEFIIEWVQIRHDLRSRKQVEQIKFTLSENPGKIVLLFNLFQKLCNGSKVFPILDRILFGFSSALKKYIISFNLVDSGAILLFFILIILRVIGSYFQWSIASLTFIMFSLRLFKYTRIIPSLGAYVHSVFRVFVRDIPRFIVIVIIICFSYIGGIHLAARQQPFAFNSSSLSLSNKLCSSTKTQLLWFNSERTLGYDLRNPLISSIIFLLDGGPGNYEQDLLNVNFLFSCLYFFFAFTIIVVLLNILIAQLSETYSEIIKTNEIHYLMELVVNLELKSNLAFITGKLFRKYLTYDMIEVPLDVWRNLKYICPGNEIEKQIEEIRERVENSEQLIQRETLKSVINHEWIQENLSEISHKFSHISLVENIESSNNISKRFNQDEMICSRISELEAQVKGQGEILHLILEAVRGKS